MKVESLTLREIRMPLLDFFETSFGRTTERHILLVTAQCDGVAGWGECVAGEGPFYLDETVETAWHVITQYLAPAVVGREVAAGREAGRLMVAVRGHRMAKGAVENALWDAEAQQKGVSLWKLLGGAQREIPCGVSLGIQDTIEQLLEKVAEELAAGYRRIKLKCKPGWDVEVFARVRERWPDILLSCDANSCYTLADAEHLKRFDQFRMLMIEQPLWADDFYFHARLQKRLATPICLDEGIRNARDAEAALELGSCGIINIKVGRVGGFSEAIAVHDVARARGVPVWCGGMLESGIGRAHNVALSTLPGFTLPGDVSASRRYWKEDIIEPEVTVSTQGTIAVSDQPGRGYRVREDLVEKVTVRKETIRR